MIGEGPSGPKSSQVVVGSRPPLQSFSQPQMECAHLPHGLGQRKAPNRRQPSSRVKGVFRMGRVRPDEFTPPIEYKLPESAFFHSNVKWLLSALG